MPNTVRIPVRFPDWVTCRNWVRGAACGAMNPIDPERPVRCVRCGRGL